MIVNDLKDLLDRVNELKDKKKVIGLITGSYDLLHEGHKFAINYSVKKSDVLIILVNSDISIKTYKGKNRPFEPLSKRMKNLENFNEDLILYKLDDVIPNELIEKIKPNIYFLSKEWSKNPVEEKVLYKVRCKLDVHPELEGFSTSSNHVVNKSKKFKENFAIFFDRDGTINKDTGYVSQTSQIEIEDINLKGLKLISELNYLNIVVTNQSGVAKGYLSEEQLKEINNKILEIINFSGGRIDKFYYDISSSQKPSIYRKPRNGMLLKAVEDFDIVLRDSWLIGDKDTDIEMAKKNHIRSIYIENKNYPYVSSYKFDFKAENLFDAYKIIKSNIST